MRRILIVACGSIKWGLLLGLVSFLLSCSTAAAPNGEGEIGCLSGEQVTRSFVSRQGATRTFRFSADCLLRGGDSVARREDGGYRLILEPYWPGMISQKQAARLHASSEVAYTRSHLILRYAPDPSAISSVVDRYVSRGEVLEKHGDHQIFKKEKRWPGEDDVMLIIHNKRKDFYATCMEISSCTIHGIHVSHKVGYEIRIYSADQYRNWEEIHNQILYFIDSALRE